MTVEKLADASDDALIGYFRDMAIRKEQNLFDTRAHNRIDRGELVPCYNELVTRGLSRLAAEGVTDVLDPLVRPFADDAGKLSRIACTNPSHTPGQEVPASESFLVKGR